MNQYLFNAINQYAGKWLCLDGTAIFFADYFQYIVVLSLGIFLLINFKKYWKVAFLALFSAVFSRAFIQIIYFLYPTQRPFEVLDVHQLVAHAPGHAFPSGHATFFFALATIIYLYNKKAGILYYIAAFLISLSRVYSGIHWPTDILGGAIFGILIALALRSFFTRFKKPLI